MSQVEFILASEQLLTDFDPVDPTNVDVQPTRVGDEAFHGRKAMTVL